jgi:hypothetical protein
MAPGGKARVIRFQILAVELTLFDDLMMQQQHTPVP